MPITNFNVCILSSPMKKLLLISIIIIISQVVYASNYYFSASGGDDSRSTLQAQNPITPWKSLDKLNTEMPEFKQGDSILFKSGEIFYGSISIAVSGTSNMPIIFSSYGTGSKPVITGLTSISNWVAIGNGVYESYNPNLGTTVNTVIINNKPFAMGRFPNTGYLTFQSHNSNISITDNQLSSTTNWAGAELVVRTTHWVIDRTKITAQAGGTLSYATPLSYMPLDNFGYFIQNDIRTLDQLGEWYYNPATKKLNVFFGNSNPSFFDVRAPFANTLVSIYNHDNVVFNNLSFVGSNLNAFDLSTSNFSQIINCDISFSGTDAITGSSVTHTRVENNNISSTNNNGVYLGYNCYYNSIKNNSIKNTLMFPGMCTSGNTTGLGIFVRGKSNVIQYNKLDSTGFTPIRFAEDSNLIQNNVITNFNFVKDDEGGIYTYNNNPGAPVNFGRKITGNIILNGIGANEGTDGNNSADGIYMDDNSGGVEITGNTIANCNNNGIYIHDAHDMIISNNTSFNNGNSQIIFKYDNIAPNGVIRNIQNNNNIYFSKKEDQMVARFQSIANDFSQMGTFNNNYYCRPLNDNFSLFTRDNNGTEISFGLNWWKTTYFKDVASVVTPVQIAPYKINSISPTNKFLNESFNSDIEGLYVYSTAANYSKSWASGQLDGGCFQGTINATAPSTYSPILGVGNIDASKLYILRFSAKADKDTVFNVYLRQSNAPYNTISLVKSFHITPTRNEYEFLLSSNTTESAASIGFATASQNLTFWIDNIKLYEANATLTNPDDSIRFEFNPTSTIKTISLDKAYMDVKGIKYSGSISLQPYTSAILLNDLAATNPATPPPSVNIINPISRAIFNVSSNILISTLSTASNDGGFIKKVDFYANGNFIGSTAKAPFNLAISNLPVGTFALVAKATDDLGIVGTSAAVNIEVKSIIISSFSIAKQSAIVDDNSLWSTEVKVGPNPASNFITLFIRGFKANQIINVAIYNMAGIQMKNFERNSSTLNSNIDISYLAAGVYNLRLTIGITIINKQFVKQ